jgi:hypothetical protein
MKAEDVKKLLPVITAFANKQPVQVKSGLTGQWAIINPDTTEFRFEHLNEMEWRVAPLEPLPESEMKEQSIFVR